MADIDLQAPGSSEPTLRAALQALLTHSIRPSEILFGAWATLWTGASVDLGAAASRNIVVDGSGGSIASFGTTGVPDFIPVIVRFTGANTLVNSTTLILPTRANITTIAGDVAIAVWEGANVWRVIAYFRANGAPLVGLSANTDASLAAGFTTTAIDDGTFSSGIYTPAPAGGNMRRIINNGAFTFAAPTQSGAYTMVIQVTNGNSAGSITFSGFSKVSGDTLTTTIGDDYLVFLTKINGFTLAQKALLQ